MPYPNFHAARINDPKQYSDFAYNKDKFGNGVDVIFGIKDGKSEVQAIRFDKNKFSASEAKVWLKKHNYNPISFTMAEDFTTSTADIATFAPYPNVILKRNTQQLPKKKKKKNSLSEKIETFLRGK